LAALDTHTQKERKTQIYIQAPCGIRTHNHSILALQDRTAMQSV